MSGEEELAKFLKDYIRVPGMPSRLAEQGIGSRHHTTYMRFAASPWDGKPVKDDYLRAVAQHMHSTRDSGGLSRLAVLCARNAVQQRIVANYTALDKPSVSSGPPSLQIDCRFWTTVLNRGSFPKANVVTLVESFGDEMPLHGLKLGHEHRALYEVLAYFQAAGVYGSVLPCEKALAERTLESPQHFVVAGGPLRNFVYAQLILPHEDCHIFPKVQILRSGQTMVGLGCDDFGALTTEDATLIENLKEMRPVLADAKALGSGFVILTIIPNPTQKNGGVFISVCGRNSIDTAIGLKVLTDADFLDHLMVDQATANAIESQAGSLQLLLKTFRDAKSFQLVARRGRA